MTFIDPPQGTSTGYRKSDGSMWYECLPGGKPGIAVCEHPGNLVNPSLWSLVAVFEKKEDRDFVLQLHARYVTQ